MRQCEHCGSTKHVVKFMYAVDLCWSHYEQMRRYGEFLPRTKYDPNEFVDRGDHVEIVLYQERTGGEVGRAIVDKADLPLVQGRKWHLSKRKNRRYAGTSSPTELHLHVLVMGKRSGFDIDHIDGDGLNCRRSNLRFLTHCQNILNQAPPKSGRLGVKWRPSRNCWVAGIRINGRSISRHVKTYMEAVAIREDMERTHFGITATELNQAVV